MHTHLHFMLTPCRLAHQLQTSLASMQQLHLLAACGYRHLTQRIFMANIVRINPPNFMQRVFCVRCIYTSVLLKKAGFYKLTPKSDYPLTYDQAQPPYKLGVTKSWNVWNSCSLRNPRRHPMETVIEDQFIRKFILGTWYKVWLSEVVIKRRHNDMVVCGVVCPLPSMPSIHFLMGYTEELLSHLLKYNVKVEIQCVPSKRNVIHKHV